MILSLRLPGHLRAVALCLLCVLPYPAGAAEGAGDPLARPLRLTLWGVSLGDAVREMETQTGVAIRFHLPDFDGDPGTVHMVAGRISLEAALEVLARRFAFRFRVAESGRVEISRGYGWVKNAPVLHAFPLPPLTGDGEAESTRLLLAELIKPLALLEDDSFLKVERHPLPDDPEGLRVTAALPPVLAAYLEAGAAALVGRDRPMADGAERSFARARGGKEWSRLAGLSAVMPEGGDLPAALGRLADTAGIAIILGAPPPASPSGPFQPAAGTSATLEEAASGLAAAWELGRPVILPHGIAFDAGEEGPAAGDNRSRELFWSGLAVEGMEARRAAEQVGDGAALITLLKNETHSPLWRDPATAMVYSPVTGRLAVIAPANAVAAVRERLARIR